MKIETSRLEGAALDWAVAKAVCPASFKDSFDPANGLPHWSRGWLRNGSPSTDWSQGGPLIERYVTALNRSSYGTWWAHSGNHLGEAICPLVAAMRAIVASQQGEEADVPDELVGQ